MTDKKLLSAKLCYGLSIVLLALPLTFGVAAVRADAETPSWGEALIDPIVKALQAIDGRLSGLETTVARFAGSFTSEQIVTRELCVSDESGARTCLSKAQLDIVLANLTMAAQPSISAPSDTVKEVAKEADAIVVEPTVTIITEENTVEGSASALAEPVEVETVPPAGSAEPPTAIAQAPMAEEGADAEGMHTNSISPVRSGDAIVSHPEVEISTVGGAPSDSE
jgi:hypothetical protein